MADDIRVDVGNETNEGTMEKRSWFEEMTEKLNKMESIPEEKKQPKQNKKNKVKFYKIPATIRRNSYPHDYEPQIVSFGPYHHGHESCKKTQQIKEQVVLQSLKRYHKKIDDYKSIFSDRSPSLDVYDELDPKWHQDRDAALQLLICDGCFLLEILREILRGGSNYSGDNLAWNIDGFNSNQLIEYYRHDMLLLENQIPMEFLYALIYCQTNSLYPEVELLERISKFISPSNNKIEREDMLLHVLEFYRCSLLSDELNTRRIWDNIPFKRVFLSCNTFLREAYSRSPRRRPVHFYCLKKIIQCLLLPVAVVFFGLKYLLITGPRNLFRTRSRANVHISIPSATELDKVGIGFTTSKTTSLNDVSFGQRNLRLPQIYVDGTNRSRFLNIIALEQVHPSSKNQVSSYIYFMSRLLQGADDVRLLQSRGIIHSSLAVNEVAELFSSLIKDIVHDPNDFLASHYRDMARRLAESFYYRMNNPLQKDLWQNYLRSPLAIVSVIAAFLLFCLTATQTVYTVLSYYNYK